MLDAAEKSLAPLPRPGWREGAVPFVRSRVSAALSSSVPGRGEGRPLGAGREEGEGWRPFAPYVDSMSGRAEASGIRAKQAIRRRTAAGINARGQRASVVDGCFGVPEDLLESRQQVPPVLGKLTAQGSPVSGWATVKVSEGILSLTFGGFKCEEDPADRGSPCGFGGTASSSADQPPFHPPAAPAQAPPECRRPAAPGPAWRGAIIRASARLCPPRCPVPARGLSYRPGFAAAQRAEACLGPRHVWLTRSRGAIHLDHPALSMLATHHIVISR